MTSRAGATPPPALLYVVKQLELVSRARLEDVLRLSGVTALQYTALTVLQRRPRMTSAELARLSFVRAQSTADLVAGLARRGLVSRAPDPDHGRRLLIELTDSGRDLLDAYDPLVAQLEERMLDGFAPDEREVFRALLVRARRALAAAPDAAQDAADLGAADPG